MQLVQPFQRRYTAILSRAIQTKRSPPVVHLQGGAQIIRSTSSTCFLSLGIPLFQSIQPATFGCLHSGRNNDSEVVSIPSVQPEEGFADLGYGRQGRSPATSCLHSLLPLREDETPGSAETPHGHRLPPEVLLRLPDFSKIAFQNYALCAVFTTKVRAIIVGIFGVVCVLVFAELHFSSALIRTIPNDSITAAHHEES